MVGRLVVAAGLCGALVVGGAGAASAAPSSSGTAPAAGTCANAQTRLDRLAAQDARITTALPKLEAAQTKAEQNHHPKLAKRIGRRVKVLEHRQTRDQKVSARIEKRCPATTPAAPASPT